MTKDSTSQDVLKVQGRMTLGYGIIPKMPMQDQRLTIEAKAIYSYFCSYAGAGTTAFPSRDKILYDLQIGEMRYYKHFNLLKQCGYISVEQNTDNTGKFKNNIYTLIELIEPYPQNRGAEPYPHFPGTDNPNTDGPDTGNEGIKSNSLKNNSLKNIISNPIQSVLTDEKEKTDWIGYDTIPNQSVMDGKEQKNKESLNANATDQSNRFAKPSAPKYSVADVEETIKENINYDYILMDDPHCKEMLDGVLHVIVSTIVTDFKGDYISMGEENVPAELVKSVFFKLTKEDIEYFIENFNRQTETTVKLKPYIRTSLYRNHGTNNFYWNNRVHVDMPQLAEKKLQSKTTE